MGPNQRRIDPSFQQRFIDRLERAYLAFRDNSGDFQKGKTFGS